MRVINWLLYSLPTTFAYTLQAFGLYRASFFCFKLLRNSNYAPALHELGVLYTLGWGTELDVEKGRQLVQQAADMGYQRSIKWLEEFGQLTQEGSQFAEHMMAEFKKLKGESPFSWRLASTILSYISFAAFVFILVSWLSTFLD